MQNAELSLKLSNLQTEKLKFETQLNDSESLRRLLAEQYTTTKAELDGLKLDYEQSKGKLTILQGKEALFNSHLSVSKEEYQVLKGKLQTIESALEARGISIGFLIHHAQQTLPSKKQRMNENQSKEIETMLPKIKIDIPQIENAEIEEADESVKENKSDVKNSPIPPMILTKTEGLKQPKKKTKQQITKPKPTILSRSKPVMHPVGKRESKLEAPTFSKLESGTRPENLAKNADSNVQKLLYGDQ